MNPADEVVSPVPAGPPASAPVRITPEAILRGIAAKGGAPWFPSMYAKETGIPRDSLDAPLGELRQIGLVRVVAWVQGAGQGYELTKDGAAALVGGEKRRTAPAEAVPAPRSDLGRADIDLRPPIVTPALILANIIWFFVGAVIASRSGVPLNSYLWRGNLYILEKLGAVSAADLLRGDWWRLATCCFVHVGMVHLVGNLVGLGTAGPLAELLWGRRRLAILYMISGLAGSCLAMAIAPLNEGTGAANVLAGASGAIWGVMTSLLAWLLLFRERLPQDLAAEWFRRLGAAFLLNAGVSLLPGISWEAHLGGGLAGFFTAGLLHALRAENRVKRRAAAVLLMAMPVLCIGGLALAMHSGDHWYPLRHQHIVRRGGPDTQAATHLNQLKPEAVNSMERDAVQILIRAPERRTPEAVADVRAKLHHLRAAAVDLEFSPRPAVQAFAGARVKSFDLLRAMLDANTIPEEQTWQQWGDSRRTADRLWAEMFPH